MDTRPWSELSCEQRLFIILEHMERVVFVVASSGTTIDQRSMNVIVETRRLLSGAMNRFSENTISMARDAIEGRQEQIGLSVKDKMHDKIYCMAKMCFEMGMDALYLSNNSQNRTLVSPDIITLPNTARLYVEPLIPVVKFDGRSSNKRQIIAFAKKCGIYI